MNMKTLYAVALAILGLIPAVSGTAALADQGSPVMTLEQSVKMEAELLAQLKASSSGSMLPRPL
jgi:hypothetical protein